MSTVPSTSAVGNQLSDFNQNALKGMAAGAFAAAISKTTVAPMDRVKLCLQLQNAASATPSAHFARLKPARPNPYRGIVDCFRRLCQDEGVRSLWRGNSAAVIRCFPHNALNIAFRDWFRVAFLNGIERRRRPVRFVTGNVAAGGVGAALALLFCYPLDFARTRLAVDGGVHRGLLHCFAAVHAQEGVAGLYRGFIASLHFTILSRAVFFGIFDSVRLTLAEERRQTLSFVATWSLAQGSIIVSSLVCYPLDTVRRRLMLEAGREYKQYSTQWQCWSTVCRTEGVRALYKGALSNSLRCTSGALILAIYYEVLKYI
uniref:ADP/ATP translocase n=1 Tax=Globodera rostochiensis TaxID=31243 RepID=A0A914HQ74_GLORO